MYTAKLKYDISPGLGLKSIFTWTNQRDYNGLHIMDISGTKIRVNWSNGRAHSHCTYLYVFVQTPINPMELHFRMTFLLLRHTVDTGYCFALIDAGAYVYNFGSKSAN